MTSMFYFSELSSLARNLCPNRMEFVDETSQIGLPYRDMCREQER